jgi:hypothetical protein
MNGGAARSKAEGRPKAKPHKSVAAGRPEAVAVAGSLWAQALRLGAAGRSRWAGPDVEPLRRRAGLAAALGAFLVLSGCGGAVSGDIGRACLVSGRDAASQALCSCVQGVANQTLSPTDQRRAARFFGDPDRAEETRFSDRPSDDAFWTRYRAFADTAEAICS